jgi:DNA primase
MDLKVAKTIDALGHRLNLPVDSLRRRLQAMRRTAAPRVGRASRAPGAAAAAAIPVAAGEGVPQRVAVAEAPLAPIRLAELDPVDRELVQIVLNDPTAVPHVITRVAPGALRDQPLRTILQTCYDVHGERQSLPSPPGDEEDSPYSEDVMLRLDDPQLRALVAALTSSMDSAPLPDDVRPASWQERLRGVLATLAERERQHRLRDIGLALAETDEVSNPDAFRALRLEYLRLMFQRPDTKKDAS